MSEFTLPGVYRGGIGVASLGLMLLSMGCTSYILMAMAPDFLTIPYGEYFAFAAGIFAEIFKNILIPVALFFIVRKKAFLSGVSALMVGGLLLALSMWSTIQFFETGALQDKQQAVASNDRYQSISNQIEVIDQSIVSQQRFIDSQLQANEAKLKINHVTSSDSTGERLESAQSGLSELVSKRESLVAQRNQVSVQSQDETPDHSGYYLLFSIILDIAPLVGMIILDSDRFHRNQANAAKKKKDAVQSLIQRTTAPSGKGTSSTENGPEEGPGDGVVAAEKVDVFEQYYSQVLDMVERGEMTPSIKNIREAVGCTEREARSINKALKESDALSDLAGQPA